MQETAINIMSNIFTKSKKKRRPRSTIIKFIGNMELVLQEKKTGYIVEGIDLNGSELQNILNQFCTQIYKIDPSLFSILCLEHGGWYTYIITRSHLQHIENAVHSSQTDFKFIAIDPELKHPNIICEETSDIVEMFLSFLRLYKENHSTVKIRENINLCMLFGVLVGYPAIYHFKDHESIDRSCLLNTEVVVVKIMANFRDADGKLELFSFSYPLILKDKLNKTINSWKDKLTSNFKNLLLLSNIQICEETTILTSVTL